MSKAASLATAAFLCLLPSGAAAIANPASVFCVRMGGRLVVAKLESGDAIGLCYITPRKIVEEWTLFRMFGGKRPPNDRNPFLRD